jgi:hypothetical protein
MIYGQVLAFTHPLIYYHHAQAQNALARSAESFEGVQRNFVRVQVKPL